MKKSVERKPSEKKNAMEELSERAKVWSHAPPGANQESLLDSTIHVASLSTFLLLWLIWMNDTKVLSNLSFSVSMRTRDIYYINQFKSYPSFHFQPYLGTDDRI